MDILAPLFIAPIVLAVIAYFASRRGTGDTAKTIGRSSVIFSISFLLAILGLFALAYAVLESLPG